MSLSEHIKALNELGVNHPCPFCGGTDLDTDTTSARFVFVFCRKCSANGPWGYNNKNAFELWGARHIVEDEDNDPLQLLDDDGNEVE